MDTNVKVKCVVYLNEEMNANIEAIADEMCLSKPDFIRYCLSTQILSYKKGIDAIDNFTQIAMKLKNVEV